MGAGRLLLIALLIFTSACKPDPARLSAEKAVVAYNIGIVQAYRDRDLNYMRPLATEEQMNKLFPQILALQASGSRMIAIREEFSIRSAKVEGGRAVVRTSEKWSYWWEDMETREVVKPKSTLSYDNAYHLKKVMGRWLVDYIEPG